MALFVIKFVTARSWLTKFTHVAVSTRSHGVKGGALRFF